MNFVAWSKASAVLMLIAASAAAQDPDLRDLESRIEYAWFTEDANSLRNLIRTTGSALAKGGESVMTRYELGLAQYRLGLLLLQKSEPGAAEAMSECIDELDKVVDADERFAEAYALQSACHGSLAGIRAWKGMVHGPLSASRMEKALNLAPNNPRIALLDGVADRERPKAFGGDKARAQTKFERAVQLFEADSGQSSNGPRWGAADAYINLGRGLLEAGDTLGARNALERALIIAPEYAAARRELRRLTESVR